MFKKKNWGKEVLGVGVQNCLSETGKGWVPSITFKKKWKIKERKEKKPKYKIWRVHILVCIHYYSKVEVLFTCILIRLF